MNDENKTQKSKKPRLHAKRSPELFKGKNDLIYPLYYKEEGAFFICMDILIAVAPLLTWAIYLYGARPLVITVLAVVFSLGLDIAANAILKKDVPFDFSPITMGIILALGMPPSAPLWLPIFGALLVVVVSHILGSKHKNILNPAAFALTVCFLLFPVIMNSIPKTGQYLKPFSLSVSGYATEKSALETVLSGFLPESGTGTLFFGMRPGAIGEMSAFLLFLGLIYLCIRGISRPLLPMVYLFTVGLIAYLEPSLTAASDTVAFNGSLYNVFDSNTVLCAVYMLSFPRGVPKSTLGKVIAGAVAGAVTIGMRYYVRVDISALAAILLINLLTPLLNLLFKPAVFGGNLKTSPAKSEKKSAGKPSERKLPSEDQDGEKKADENTPVEEQTKEEQTEEEQTEEGQTGEGQTAEKLA